jgi:hypothetical protein
VINHDYALRLWAPRESFWAREDEYRAGLMLDDARRLLSDAPGDAFAAVYAAFAQEQFDRAQARAVEAARAAAAYDSSDSSDTFSLSDFPDDSGSSDAGDDSDAGAADASDAGDDSDAGAADASDAEADADAGAADASDALDAGPATDLATPVVPPTVTAEPAREQSWQQYESPAETEASVQERGTAQSRMLNLDAAPLRARGHEARTRAPGVAVSAVASPPVRPDRRVSIRPAAGERSFDLGRVARRLGYTNHLAALRAGPHEERVAEELGAALAEHISTEVGSREVLGETGIILRTDENDLSLPGLTLGQVVANLLHHRVVIDTPARTDPFEVCPSNVPG